MTPLPVPRPWYNFFEELAVPPLDREAARTLVTRPVAGELAFAAEVVESIVDRCQGRPEPIQRRCSALVERAIARRRCRVDVEDLEAVVEEVSIRWSSRPRRRPPLTWQSHPQ